MIFLADPVLRLALYVCAASAVVCWLLSVVNDNYSQVDRLWSIAPVAYVIGFAAAARFSDPRLDLMAVLALCWGARLTYNFWRKGGYEPGGEDYRWPILRARFGEVGFQIFNATFIAPFQNLLLLALSLPAWVALRHPSPLGALDVVCAIAFVLFLAGETIADEQQWRFHFAKKRPGYSGPPFLTTGLFRFSRHPNFFCEISLWWCMYLFSVAAGAGWWTLALSGPVVLTLLFQGSTTMTERVSLSKYPSYAAYKERTSRLVPLP